MSVGTGTARPADEPSKRPPIFIVGVGRSGTTLLMAMLNAHSDVVFPPETHFLRHFVVPNPRATRAQATEMIARDRYVQRLGFSADGIALGFPEDRADSRWHDAYSTMLAEVKRRAGKPIVGDKDPKNVEYLPLLHELFPRAKVLHMVRDPRDVLASRMRAGWSKRRPLLLNVLAYRAQLRMGRNEGRRRFGDRYMEVQYERLISEPRETLAVVCRFLGVSYDPQMLEYHESSSRLVAPDEAEWKKNVTRPLLSENAGKWRQELTRSQVLQAERLCSDVFGPDGPYVRSIGRPGWGEQLRSLLCVPIGWGLDWAYRIWLRRRNRRSMARLGG
jgi:hypothetical protein